MENEKDFENEAVSGVATAGAKAGVDANASTAKPAMGMSATDASTEATAADVANAGAATDADTSVASQTTTPDASDTAMTVAGTSELAPSDFEEAYDGQGADDEPIEFNSDFTLTEVRKYAVSILKGNFGRTYPHALLYTVLVMLPTMVLYILGVFKSTTNPTAATVIEIIGVLIPFIIGGPLYMGLLAGFFDIAEGKKFKIKRLFYAFRDDHFFKSVGAFLLVSVIVIVAGTILQLPAIIIDALSSNLSAGFAYTATTVITVLLEIVGVVIAALLAVRLIFIFPILIDHPRMKVTRALKLSWQAMKGSEIKYILLILSYMGWYLLSFAIACAVVAGIAYAGYSYIMSLADFYTAYMYLLIGMIILYPLAYVAIMIASSTVATRPVSATVAFYRMMTRKGVDPDGSGAYYDAYAEPFAGAATASTDAGHDAYAEPFAGAAGTDAKHDAYTKPFAGTTSLDAMHDTYANTFTDAATDADAQHDSYAASPDVTADIEGFKSDEPVEY